MWDLNDCLNALDFLVNEKPLRGNVIGNETIVNGRHEIYVDTCFAFDTGMYETAIGIDHNDLIIVEEYEDSEAAESGHAKWMTYVQKPYPLSFTSIQVLEITVVED